MFLRAIETVSLNDDLCGIMAVYIVGCPALYPRVIFVMPPDLDATASLY